MKRQLRENMRRLNRRLVAWVALVLAMLLVALQEAPLAPAPVHGYDAAATLSVDSDLTPDEAPAPAPDDGEDETKNQRGESSEDDVVLDNGTCVLLVLELKRPRAMILEPDSRHTQRLERPPIHAA